jgi:hypothetical protein
MKFYNLWKDCGKDYGYFNLFSIDYDIDARWLEVILFNFLVVLTGDK